MSLLFRNRWFALVWLATSAASAAFFVSEEGGVHRLQDGAAQIQAQLKARQEARTSSSHFIDGGEADTTPAVLLPAGDPMADPNDPQPGDVFIDAVSGRRVKIVGDAYADGE